MRVFFARVKCMQEQQQSIWWQRKRATLLELAEQNLNAFVYDLDTIGAAAQSVLSMASVSRVLYAMKANFNADVLRKLADGGVDFDCVSPGEVQHLRNVLPGNAKNRILFTPNFAPRDEYAWGIREGLQVTLDNLYPLKAWPELFADQALFVRIDPDQGGGHHEHVVTVGKTSKFGVSLSELDELVTLVDKCGAHVVGIHAHSGSGILEPENWRAVADALLTVAARFPEVRILDLGGGIGVPEKRGDPVLILQRLTAISVTSSLPILTTSYGLSQDVILLLLPVRCSLMSRSSKAKMTYVTSVSVRALMH